MELGYMAIMALHLLASIIYFKINIITAFKDEETELQRVKKL
jgi:hypothetical protein